MENREIDGIFFLNILANVLQVANYILSVEDLKNSDLFAELQRQNKEYLTKIIEQNELIIEQNKELLLKER